jgi:hypothetical protein
VVLLPPEPRFSRGGAGAGCLRTKTRSLAKPRRRHEKTFEQGVFASSRLGERNVVLLHRKPDLSPGHGDTGRQRTPLLGSSPRLRASTRTSGLFPAGTPILSLRRGGAEECRAVGFLVSSWARASLRAFRFFKAKTRSLAKPRRRQGKTFKQGFFASSRLCERNAVLLHRKPDLSPGHRYHGKTEDTLARVFSASPRLRESILSSRKQTTRISREDAKARRNALNWVPLRLRGLARAIFPISIEPPISARAH